MRDSLRLTCEGEVQIECVVTGEGLNEKFSKFVLVGFDDEKATLITAADLSEISRAMELVGDIFEQAMNRKNVFDQLGGSE